MKHASDAPPESGPRPARSVTDPRKPLGPAATVRLDGDVIARIDAIAARRKVTRAAVLRELIALGLPVSERRSGHPLLVLRSRWGDRAIPLRRGRDD